MMTIKYSFQPFLCKRQKHKRKLMELIISSIMNFSQEIYRSNSPFTSFYVFTSLWGLARELYADGNLSKPTTLHGESIALRPALKTFSEKKSTFVAEIPVLTGCNNSMETRYLGPDHVYQFVDSIRNEYVDPEEVNKEIYDLCQESYKLIVRAHNLQRQKASEVLLFVCTDSDREFNKDKPSSIPIAYALKGKSI